MNKNRLPITENEGSYPGVLVFSVTNACYRGTKEILDDKRIPMKPEECLRRCFSAGRYLMKASKTKDGGFQACIYIGNLVFFAVPGDKQDSFVLRRPLEETARDVTEEIRYGVNLTAQGGTVLHFRLKEQNLFVSFLGGQIMPEDQAKRAYTDTAAVLNLLRQKMETADALRRRLIAQQKEASDEKEPEISPEFDEYLSLAGSYAQYEDEAAQRDAQSVAPLACFHLQAAEDYNRQDRIAYTYSVEGEFDEKVFGQNTKVTVGLKNEKETAATIVAMDSSGGRKTITLLFDEQLDVDDLPDPALVSLSYSSVMYDVQREVYEDLENNRTRAAFLDRCVGQAAPEPYQMASLVSLKEELAKKKYPPTGSQMEAIVRGISCEDMLLVQGPPGTGKTTVILEWVRYFCKEKGLRVLVSSQNNKAVDNVLERLAEEEGIDAIRAGNEAKVEEKIKPLLLENKIHDYRESAEKKLRTNHGILREMKEAISAMLAVYGQIQPQVERFEAEKKEAESIRFLIQGGIREASERYRVSAEDAVAKAMRAQQKASQAAQKMDAASFPLIRAIFRFQTNTWLGRYEKAYRALSETENIYRTELYAMTDRLLRNNPCDRDAQIRALFQDINCLFDEVVRFQPKHTAFVSPEIFELPQQCSTGAVFSKRRQLQEEAERIAEKEAIVSDWGDIMLRQNNYALSDALLESVNLVGGTCIGINSQKKFANINFDVTIIDEAGQIQIHNALVPMSRSPKLLMLGDHKQIPPIANDYAIMRCEEDDIDATLEKKSLFEELFGRFPKENKMMLDTQFRMPKEIADVLSDWFYEGKYYSFSGKANMPPLFPELFSSCFVIVDTGRAPGHGEQRLAQGYENRYEANLAARLVEYMRKDEKIKLDEIGIISPYAGQIGCLKALLSNLPAVGDAASEIAATLDSFQGQERDVIIYCATRSNKKGAIGFLKELRRLNVALSRPKKTLIFIGDMPFLEHGGDKDFSAFMKKMSERVKNGGGCYIESEELLSKLKEAV